MQSSSSLKFFEGHKVRPSMSSCQRSKTSSPLENYMQKLSSNIILCWVDGKALIKRVLFIYFLIEKFCWLLGNWNVSLSSGCPADGRWKKNSTPPVCHWNITSAHEWFCWALWYVFGVCVVFSTFVAVLAYTRPKQDATRSQKSFSNKLWSIYHIE